MKKVIFAVIFSMLSAASHSYATADVRISVSVNGKFVEFAEQAPVLIDDRTFIPVRGVFEKMGMDVLWNEADKSISITSNEKSVLLTIDRPDMSVSTQDSTSKKTLDAAPVIINNKALLPIRQVAEEFGAAVDWIALDQQVMITTLDHIEKIAEQEHYIGDKYRKAEELLVDCGNCFALNNEYLFKPVAIPDKSAYKYAETINMIASKLHNVNIYNMLVIDSNEIYAPTRFYTGQKRSAELIYSELNDTIIPVRAADTLIQYADEKIYFNTDHHWTHRGAFYAWQTFLETKGEKPLDLSTFKKSDTDAFTGSYLTRMPEHLVPPSLNRTETMERFLPQYEVDVTVYKDAQMTQMMGKVPLINLQNNAYSTFISGDHPLTVLKSSVANGKKLAIIKESFGNALATWAINNYEYVYVIDIRGFKGGKLSISDFHQQTKFEDLIIESYPSTIASDELRGYIAEMAQ